MLKNMKLFLIVAAALMFFIGFAGCAVNRVGQMPNGGGLNVIKEINVEEVDNKTKVTIVGMLPANYTAFKLANPLRIVIDIADANVTAVKSPVSVSNGTVGAISVTQFDEAGSNIGRVEIGLDKIADYRVAKEGNNLVVIVDRVPGPVVSWESMSDAALLEPIDTLEVKDSADIQQQVEVESKDVPEEVGEIRTSADLKAEEKVAAPEKDMPKARALIDFRVEKGEGYLKVIAVGDGSIGNYNAFRLGKPDRLVVDIFDVKSKDKRKRIDVSDSLLKGIRIGQHKNKVRMVLDKPSAGPSEYHVEKYGDSLVVVLGEKGEIRKHSLSARVDDEKVTLKSLAKIADIEGIKFTQTPESSRVIISADSPLEYEVKRLSQDKVAIDLAGASIPKKLQRSLDTSEFNSPISLISSYQLKKGPESVVRVLISLSKETEYKASYEDGSIYFDFERDAGQDSVIEDDDMTVEVVRAVASLPSPPVLEQTIEPLSVAASSEIKAELPAIEPGEIASSGFSQKKGTTLGVEEQGYTGQRISLDYKDADISNVLRLFAEVSGFNVIAADDVKGSVTVKLHDVPWDQAFDIVLDAKGLGMVRKGNVIRIAPAEKLKKEEEDALAANAVKEKLVDLTSEIIPVSHAPVAEMANKIEKIKTDRGSITVDERSSLLIIRDVPRVIKEARLLITKLDKPTPQVLIEARIVEVDVNHQKDLGVQWGGGYTADAAHGNALNYGFPNSMQTGIGAGGGWALNAPNAGATGTGLGGGEAGGTIGLSFGSIDNTLSLDLKLSALESKGVSKIISRPRIVTINKQEAKIQQGLSIPFVTTSAEGTKTEFIDASLELTVTPEVKQDKSIILSIKVSKNEPDFARAAAGSPSISKKEAKTMVLIKDGDTTVIGGIFTQKEGESESGVPILKDIPLIGWLFRSTNKTNDKAELLIFITARIVNDVI